VEVGGTSVLLEYERQNVLQLWLMPQLQYVRYVKPITVSSAKNNEVYILTGDCTKHIDFRRVTLMLHQIMDCLTSEAMLIVQGLHFFMDILCSHIFSPQKPHNATIFVLVAPSLNRCASQ
jgi:hypothetical protein